MGIYFYNGYLKLRCWIDQHCDSFRMLRSMGEKPFSSPFCCSKIRAAVKLFENSDKTRSAVRNSKEKAVQTSCHSIIKDAEKCASGLKSTLTLQHPNPRATTEDGDEIGGKKITSTLAKAQQKAYCDTLGKEKWQGKLTKNRSVGYSLRLTILRGTTQLLKSCSLRC